MGRDELARSGAKRALQFRATKGLAPSEPCDIYEMINQSEIDLQFCDIPSLEGVYLDELESRRICVTSHRPAGRQKFTAAHELGHHLFGHGTQVEQIVELRRTNPSLEPNELVADSFARVILMPPRAVHAAFRLRKAVPQEADPKSIYQASCWLGVGYTTLLEQMRWSLGLLNHGAFSRLSKLTLKSIKADVLRIPSNEDVWPLDAHWASRRLHAQVGDLILGLRLEARDAGSILSAFDGKKGAILRASSPGSAEFPLEAGGKVRICVSRRGYVGLYQYRYLEE